MIELVAALALAAAGLWVLGISDDDRTLAIVAAGAALIALRSYRRRSRLGLVERSRATIGGTRAWVEAALATLALTAGVAVAVAPFSEPYDEARWWIVTRPEYGVALWVARRLLLAFVQQLALQRFLWPLCQELVGARWAATALAATVFGLLHLPSPTLAVVTAVAAAVWILLYRRSRRLAPLVVSHALLWIVAFAVIPDRLTYDLHVGREAVDTLPRYRLLAAPEAREILRVTASDDYYAAQGGTSPGFVKALYRDVLGRVPAPWEVAFWVDRMRWESRVEVAKKFVISDELQAIRREYGPAYSFPFRPGAGR